MIAISHAARRWAIKELARRAGVSHDFFRSWVIEITPRDTIIHLQPGTAKQIRFENLPNGVGDDLAGPKFETVHADWMDSHEPQHGAAIPDFVVPFCRRAGSGRRPLFSRIGADRVECFADLAASTIFNLCRVEEIQPRHLDEHARFSASTSVAARDGFLDRPVVDEWGFALGQAIQALVPAWHPKKRHLRARTSHDIDEVGSVDRLWRIPRGGESAFLTGWMMLPLLSCRTIQ